MKMFALAVALSTSLFAAQPARAGDPETYIKFLTAMEGSWEGLAWGSQGGSFNMSSFVGRQGDTMAWSMNTRRGGGIKQSSTTDFFVAGEILSVNDDLVFGGSTIVNEVTDHSLRYTIQSFGGGHFIDYIFKYDVSGDGMSGELRVEQDGMRVYDEGWSLTRQH